MYNNIQYTLRSESIWLVYLLENQIPDPICYVLCEIDSFSMRFKFLKSKPISLHSFQSWSQIILIFPMHSQLVAEFNFKESVYIFLWQLYSYYYSVKTSTHDWRLDSQKSHRIFCLCI